MLALRVAPIQKVRTLERVPVLLIFNLLIVDAQIELLLPGLLVVLLMLRLVLRASPQELPLLLLSVIDCRTAAVVVVVVGGCRCGPAKTNVGLVVVVVAHLALASTTTLVADNSIEATPPLNRQVELTSGQTPDSSRNERAADDDAARLATSGHLRAASRKFDKSSPQTKTTAGPFECGLNHEHSCRRRRRR